MPSSFDVAVLGAGPAGLAAALVAARRSASVVVLERAPVVGGMAASYEVAGQRVDHGSHRLHPSIDPAILADLRGMLGDDLQVRERNGRIRLADRWLVFPLRTGDMLQQLPRAFAARAARDSLLAPLRRPRADTFSEVVRARLGPTVGGEFYEPYVQKLWGVPGRELSGELARRRVSATSPADIVRRLVRARTPEGRTFLYPRRGFGQITEALADAATAAGAEIRVQADVSGVAVRHGRCTITTTAAAGTEAGIEVGQVWSSLPVGPLVAMMRPEPPLDVVDAAAALQHRALLLVHLVVPRPQYSPFDAHYFPSIDNPVARLSEPKNYRHGADPAGLTVLCAEVPCWEGDDRWRATDEELGAEVAEALVRAGLPAPDHSEVAVRRLPRVYPVVRPGTAAQLGDAERWLAEVGTDPSGRRRLVTFGRQGLFVPDNTHHVLAMGWDLGERWDPEGMDPAAWASARAGFRSHVVED